MSCVRFPASILSVKAGPKAGQTVVVISADAGLGETHFALVLEPACADQLASALSKVRSGQVGVVTVRGLAGEAAQASRLVAAGDVRNG